MEIIGWLGSLLFGCYLAGSGLTAGIFALRFNTNWKEKSYTLFLGVVGVAIIAWAVSNAPFSITFN